MKSEKVWTSLLYAFSLLLFTSVAWAAELPAGYTAVEYIGSTPGGGQYIDTGYIPNIDTYIECVVELPDGQPRSEAAVFGARIAVGTVPSELLTFGFG